MSANKISPESELKEVQNLSNLRRFSETDETIVRLAGVLFAGDLLLVGLILSGLIICPWVVPAVVATGAFLLIAYVAMKRFKEPEMIGVQEEKTPLSNPSIDDFFKVEEMSQMDLEEQTKNQEEAQKRTAIAEWKELQQDLPLLKANRLDVFLEAYCQVKNRENQKTQVYGFIPQTRGEQAKLIEEYEWADGQQYLIFGMGITGSAHSLSPQSLFRQGINFLRGQSRECHQTLVVIDKSNPENPILWFYDPKGRSPSLAQPDAATNRPLSERLEEIRTQFSEKFGKDLEFRQLRAGLFQADQPLWNGNHCVYLCARTAMELGESNQPEQAVIRAKPPLETVESVKTYLTQAFPESEEN